MDLLANTIDGVRTANSLASWTRGCCVPPKKTFFLAVQHPLLGPTKTVTHLARSRSVRIGVVRLEKSLVANLSAKRNVSLAKRDFLVANGRMAADFSSPDIAFTTQHSFLCCPRIYRFCSVFSFRVILVRLNGEPPSNDSEKLRQTETGCSCDSSLFFFVCPVQSRSSALQIPSVRRETLRSSVTKNKTGQNQRVCENQLEKKTCLGI